MLIYAILVTFMLGYLIGVCHAVFYSLHLEKKDAATLQKNFDQNVSILNYDNAPTPNPFS